MSDGVTAMKPAKIFMQFVIAINDHDIKALSALMTTDHAFVDSVGNRVHGATPMEAGWRGYFAMCPDYWIHTDHVTAEDGIRDLVRSRGLGDVYKRQDPLSLLVDSFALGILLRVHRDADGEDLMLLDLLDHLWQP